MRMYGLEGITIRVVEIRFVSCCYLKWVWLASGGDTLLSGPAPRSQMSGVVMIWKDGRRDGSGSW